MVKIKYSIDHPLVKWWSTQIGKVILNFTALELETYRWLVQLTENPKKIQEWSKRTFGGRVKEIISYVDTRAYTPEWKIKSMAKWREAKLIARKRNRIVHNPLMFGWFDNKEEREPDYVGIVDMRNQKKTDPFMKKEELSAIVNRILDLAIELESLRKEWCSVRDE